MARLLRSTSQSVIRKPTAVGPAVTFRPPAVTLAAVSSRGTMVRRFARWQLRPPTAIGPAVTFRPVKVALVPSPRQGRRPVYQLRPPAVVGPPVTSPPLRLQLTQARRPRLVSYTLRPPILQAAVVVTFVASPLTIRLAATRKPRLVSAALRPPAVVGPPVVFRPLNLALVAFRERLNMPRRQGRSRLQPPAAVGSPVVFGPVKVKTVTQPRAFQHARSELSPPTVIGPAIAFAGPRVKLALQLPRRPVAYTLRPPAKVSPAVTFRPLQLKMVQTPRRAFKVTSRLQPPTVTGAVVITALFAPVQVRLTRARPVRPVAYTLRKPAVVGPATVSAPLTIRLAPSARQGRRPSSELRPPTVVGAAVVFAAIKTRLAPSTRSGRAPRSRLSPPTVLSSFVAAPLRIMLTRARRQPPTASKLRKPTVTAPPIVFGPLRILKAVPIPRAARNVLSKLRAPAVIQLFPFITGRFDRPGPTGTTGDAPLEGGYTTPGPAGTSGSAPSQSDFDSPHPGGQ